MNSLAAIGHHRSRPCRRTSGAKASTGSAVATARGGGARSAAGSPSPQPASRARPASEAATASTCAWVVIRASGDRRAAERVHLPAALLDAHREGAQAGPGHREQRAADVTLDVGPRYLHLTQRLAQLRLEPLEGDPEQDVAARVARGRRVA